MKDVRVKSKSKKVWIALAVGLAILVASGVLYQRSGGGQLEIAPRKGPVVEAVYGLGTVVAPKTFQAKLGVSRIVRKLYVSEGEPIRAGQPLIQFDEGSVVKAPFDGTVTAVPVKEGELAFPQVPTVTLTHLAGLYLELSLEQQAALRVRPGLGAVVSFETIRSERLAGQVKAVFPREQQFIVRVDVDHLPEGVLPGMTADVAIEVGRKAEALLIPIRALSAGTVTVIRDGKKHKQSVRLGVMDGEWGEVVAGDIQLTDLLLVRAK